MKVLVLGSSGMLGHKVFELLSKNSKLTVIGTTRNKLEDKNTKTFIAGIDSVASLIEEIQPHYLINCVGIIKPNISENNLNSKINAIQINSHFPLEIIKAIKDKAIRVIQIGTDCVYSGSKGDYSEIAQHDALDVYGKTKSLGEAQDVKLMFIRCSIIGPEKTNKISLLEWFLNQPLNAKIQGYRNHIWNGISTLHFARLCETLITTSNFESGIFHFLPRDKVSKDLLLTHFSRHFGRDDIQIDSRDAAQAIDRSLSTLKPEFNLKLWKLMGYVDIPKIEDLVREMAVDYKLTH